LKAQNRSQNPCWLSGGRGSFPINRPLHPWFNDGKRVENFEEFIQQSNTPSFMEDNKYIECVSSSLEDQWLALIEINLSMPSLKPKFIRIQQGDRIRWPYSLYSIKIVPIHSNQYKDSILYSNFCLTHFRLKFWVYKVTSSWRNMSGVELFWGVKLAYLLIVNFEVIS